MKLGVMFPKKAPPPRRRIHYRSRKKYLSNRPKGAGPNWLDSYGPSTPPNGYPCQSGFKSPRRKWNPKRTPPE
jgi:hypothetical protein